MWYSLPPPATKKSDSSSGGGCRRRFPFKSVAAIAASIPRLSLSRSDPLSLADYSSIMFCLSSLISLDFEIAPSRIDCDCVCVLELDFTQLSIFSFLIRTKWRTHTQIYKKPGSNIHLGQVWKIPKIPLVEVLHKFLAFVAYFSWTLWLHDFHIRYRNFMNFIPLNVTL